MDITVNEELKAYIDPLTPDEYRALEQSILAEGCRDALILWGSVLVDGHNRYAICTKHRLPFQTIQSTRFQSMEDVHLWMIDQHLGRRSLSDFQRGVLALRKREIFAQRLAQTEQEAAVSQDSDSDATTERAPTPAPTPEAQETTREALARVARLSSSQVLQIEKIQKKAAPEVVAAVKAGEISINAAATVASLPLEEQVAAATAGKEELKQAAKRVREARRKPVTVPAQAPDTGAAAAEAEDTIESLRQRVAVLTAENRELREQLARLHDNSRFAD
jgi:hypothetical protein